MNTKPTAGSSLENLKAQLHELAQPKPIYTPQYVHAEHSLKYDWTGWTANAAPFPPSTPDAIQDTKAPWETDGLTLDTYKITENRVQILFEASPSISPTLCATRIKGRLQHTLRKMGTAVPFSRKIAMRSLGNNRRTTVEKYIARQVKDEDFVDPRFVETLKQYSIEQTDVDLSEPISTNSGRYWYNLHLVLVTGGRFRISRQDNMALIRDTSLKIAEKKGYALKSVSVMPDHLHLALRGDVEHSPEDIAMAYLNNLAYKMGQNSVWQHEYYAGTFSEYDVRAIRR